jgi:hypothetical protein
MYDCQSAYCVACSPRSGRADPFVCPPCRRACSPVGDAYADDSCGAAAIKLRINESFVEATRAACARAPGPHRVLALDTGATAKRLLSAIDGVTVVVPNPSAEVRARVVALGGGGARHVHARVGAFLTLAKAREPEMLGFTSVWMDYCGTYRGSSSSHVRPRHDMRKLWEYGLRPRDGTPRLVAVTFCTRDPRGAFGADDIVREQLACAGEHGWRAEAAYVRTYGQMVYIMFVAF